MDEKKAMEEMKRLKGTETEKNLAAAFAGESQAHVKYTLFAREAEKDPAMPRQIAAILDETAGQERAHAKIWFWLLGDLKKTAKDHLGMAADGEKEEWTSMYPGFAKKAKEEGFETIAYLFERVAEIEKRHEKQYRMVIANIENEKLFRRDEKRLWMCGNCGFIAESVAAPEECPVCGHPKSFFAIRNEMD